MTGMKVLSTETWYGSGYCGVCGDKNVIPNSVRYWCPDDGWKIGVLCPCCTDDCKNRGPLKHDYAVFAMDTERQKQIADALAADGDLDFAQSEMEDME